MICENNSVYFKCPHTQNWRFGKVTSIAPLIVIVRYGKKAWFLPREYAEKNVKTPLEFKRWQNWQKELVDKL